MSSVYRLTTTDNPFNPIKEFDEWLAFDSAKEYDSCSYLNRIVESKVQKLFKGKSFEDLSPSVQRFLLDAAIDEIIEEDVLGVYVKIPIKTT